MSIPRLKNGNTIEPSQTSKIVKTTDILLNEEIEHSKNVEHRQQAVDQITGKENLKPERKFKPCEIENPKNIFIYYKKEGNKLI